MRQGRTEAVALALGWFSITLGLAELLAPRAVARASGLEGREALLRFYGLREIASGAGLLLARNRMPWAAARVAGDALDIATLARGHDGKSRAALAAVAGVTALDVYATQKLRSARAVDRPARPDYRSRSGLPKSPQQMRGAWRHYREMRAGNRIHAPMAPSA